LRRDYDRFVERGAEILVIGPEGPKKFQEYWEEHDLPFTGLPDPKHSVLKRYGQQIKLFKMGRMPAQILVDRQGQVRYVHYGQSMSDIPENEELLDLLDQLIAEEQSEKTRV
jgi:peroxiredoxin Q/BCP